MVAQLIAKVPKAAIELGDAFILRHRSLHVEGETAVSRCIDDRWPQPRIASSDFDRRMKQWMLHDMFLTRPNEMVAQLFATTPTFGPGHYLDEAENTVTAADLGLLACNPSQALAKRLAPWTAWILDRIAEAHAEDSDAR